MSIPETQFLDVRDVAEALIVFSVEGDLEKEKPTPPEGADKKIPNAEDLDPTYGDPWADRRDMLTER